MLFKSSLSVLLSCCFLVATCAAAQQKPAAPSSAPSKPFLAQRHISAGLECASCHGEGKKIPVKSAKCLECHESFKAVAERTKDMNPNPHANHLVDTDSVECTQCHHGHKTDEIVCLDCHQNFTFDRKK
jgi:hypothetical protein